MCLEMGLALPTTTFHLRRSAQDKPTSRCKTTLWMLTILSYKPVIPGVAFIWQINKKVIKTTFQSWILSQNHSANNRYIFILSSPQTIPYNKPLCVRVNPYSSFVHPWFDISIIATAIITYHSYRYNNTRSSPQLNSFGCATATILHAQSKHIQLRSQPVMIVFSMNGHR